MTTRELAISAAQAEDTQDLLNHIAWTDVLLPKFTAAINQYQSILVNEALGGPLPPGRTREQVAGMAYGLKFAQITIEKILRDGRRASENLQLEGISIA